MSTEEGDEEPLLKKSAGTEASAYEATVSFKQNDKQANVLGLHCLFFGLH